MRPDRPLVDNWGVRYADKSAKERKARQERNYARALRERAIERALDPYSRGIVGALADPVAAAAAGLLGLDANGIAAAIAGSPDESRIAKGKTSRLPSSFPDLSEMLHPEMTDPNLGTTPEQQFQQNRITGPLKTSPEDRPLKVNRYGEINIPGFREATFDPFQELDVGYKTSTGSDKGRKARSVADVVLGEAGGATPQERLTEMLGIASVIENRAKALSITPEEVVAQDNQFDAYNKPLPPGVEKYSGLAKQALDYVKQNGPVTPAHYFSKTGTPAPDAPGGVTVAQSGPAHTFYNGQFGGVKPASAPKAAANVTSGSWSTTPTANIPGVDGRLTDIMSKASAEFAARNPGYSVQGFSGKKGRATGTPNHPTGRAIDVNIIGPDGRALPNVRNGETFGIYQDFANTAKSVQVRDYPELNDDFAWGGYFQQGTAFDQMHFDIGGVRGAFGNWQTGLNPAGKAAMARLGFPNVQNVGWNMATPDVPMPVARPETISPEQSIPDLAQAVYSPEVAGIVSPENVSASSLPEVAAMTSPEVASAYSSPERAVSPAVEAISAMDVNPIDTGVPRSAFDVMSVESSPAAIAGRVVGSMVGPESLPPDRPMPLGSMSLPNLNQIQDTPPSLPANVPDLPAAVSQYDTPPADLPEFPAAPEEPSNWSKFKTAASPVVSNAMLGNTVAGLPGMVAGAALGLAPQFGLNLDLGPQFDAAVPQKDRFSTGYGLGAISAAMGGPFGATGHSLSNPGMSYVSLGPKAGTGGVGLRRSDKYGWTEVVGPNGEVRGIRYDNPTGGGIFGSLSRALSDRFGGGFTDAERSYADTHAGLF